MIHSLFDTREINQILAKLPSLSGAAGTRNLLREDWCRSLARDSRLTSVVQNAIGKDAMPVRSILFDKSAESNWTLGWHQDTKIAVRHRVEVPGFSAWSEKEGVTHCRPPVAVLEASIAVRIHLDRCDATNGPLRVIPGSHLTGIQSSVDEINDSASHECLAEPGDVLLMKPLLFHASSKSTGTLTHRRVIHIEYCSAQLPQGLEWAFA